MDRRDPLQPHLLYIGGEDHHLRIPAMCALRDHGFRITAVASGDPAPFARAGIRYRDFQFKRFVNPRADWAAIKSLAKILVEERPDLAQSFDTKPSIFLPLAARSAPGVLAIRTINGRAFLYSSRSPLALTLRPVYRALHKLAARTAAATVFEIGDDRAFFERNGIAGKMPVLIRGAGVDVEGFDRALGSGPSPDQLRRELGLGDAEVVITVTRMTRQKGIPALLDAAARVHAVRPDVRFLLVGPRESEGPLAITQAEIDRHAPYVKAIGPRSDIPALLRLANVFAFPTEYREGVPRVLLEAALAGLPIVTTTMPGCAEVIRDGWNGLLVPPGAPPVLAAKILHLLADRAKGLAMAGRAAEYVRREFSLATVVDRHAALYKQLIDGTPPAWFKDGRLASTAKGDTCGAL
ncbi:glycosyltransferase [Bradyrhizobium sp. LB11.1]|uniref:glycosyltransferase n=1 Tax=Bradyrhizobium sp. LB11.1 TaxID=3156326 RepID=UPI003396D0B6